jgi:hypothetical protein
MRAIPKRNWKVGVIGFPFAAACFFGAAFFQARASKPSFAALDIVLAMSYIGLSAFCFKKSKQP